MLKKLFAFFSLVLIFIVLNFSIKANAYNTFNSHKLIYGVGNYGAST